jgi:pimeloyl-ACP methyl ester carboxylesterase
MSRDTGYAPLGLETDAAALGLTVTTVSSSLGTVVARSRRTSSSPRATIFLHGAAGSWSTWTPLLATAEANEISIPNPIFLDLPGWGDGVLTDAGQLVVIDAVCSLVKDAAEELGFTEWDLVGHSMGGFIALHMASIWPEWVLSVGVVSVTSWSVIATVEHPVRRFFALPGFASLRAVMRMLAATGPAGGGLVRFLAFAHLLRGATAPLFRHPSRIPHSVIAALGDEVRPREFGLASAIARDYPADALWSAIECPVRATKGDRDVFTTDADYEHLGRVLPDSVRSVIPDCGHFALVERPFEVLVALGYLS